MLTFLRKIRKSLIESGSARKYLLYAIGEVALVVIGILIALQINNWNENQKQLKVEKEILKDIEAGLEYDLEIISKAIDDHMIFIESQNKIKDWLDGKLEYNESLESHFGKITFASLFWPKDAPFEALVDFGIRNVSNKELRDQISSLYDYQYQEMLFWQDHYKKTSIEFRNTFDELEFEFIQDSSDILLGMRPTNPDLFLNSKAFKFNLIKTSSTLKIHTERKLKIVQDEIKKTIKMIKS